MNTAKVANNMKLSEILPKDWIFAHHRLWEAFSDAKLWLITYMVAPIIMLVEKYIFNDWQFLKYLTIVMILDILTALLRVYLKEGSDHITSRGMRQTVVKTVQYFVFLITIHLLTNIHVQGERITIYDWILDVAYTFLIVIEVRSIWENLMGMSNKFDLTGFIEKITNSEIWQKKQDNEEIVEKKENTEDGAE